MLASTHYSLDPFNWDGFRTDIFKILGIRLTAFHKTFASFGGESKSLLWWLEKPEKANFSRVSEIGSTKSMAKVQLHVFSPLLQLKCKKS